MKKGFTYIELLTPLFIITLLLAIAYPSYHHYLIRVHRDDGKSALLDLAARMENYYAENHTYVDATLGASGAKDIRSNDLSPEGWYQLSIPRQSATGYTLQATPLESQGSGDISCQSLTLNNLGEKSITQGPAGTPTDTAEHCW